MRIRRSVHRPATTAGVSCRSPPGGDRPDGTAGDAADHDQRTDLPCCKAGHAVHPGLGADKLRPVRRPGRRLLAVAATGHLPGVRLSTSIVQMCATPPFSCVYAIVAGPASGRSSRRRGRRTSRARAIWSVRLLASAPGSLSPSCRLESRERFGDEGAVRLGIRRACGFVATSTDHIPDRRRWMWRSDRRHREQARCRHAPQGGVGGAGTRRRGPL